EYLDEKVRAAVDDFWVIGELRRRVHHAEELYDTLHLVEAAEFGAHHREEVEADGARVLVGLLGREVAPDLAGGPAAVLAHARALAGEEEQVAGAYGIHVVGDRGRHLAQVDAELFQ